MDRRRFVRAVAASTGSVAVGGCLDDSDEVISDDSEGPQRYSLPAYSVWPPAESHDTGGVVVMHMQLQQVTTVTAALEADPDTDGPLFELPLLSAETVPDAVETLSSYPFAAKLREAVNTAANAGNPPGGGNQTVVEPLEEPAEPINESNGTATDGTGTNTTDNSSGEVIIGSGDTDTSDPDSETPPFEVTELTLADDVLLFHGSYDLAQIADRYSTGFQQVDEQRGVRIYEETADQGGLGFAVGSDVLIVPTEQSRESPAETVLAHSLSGYINTLGRVVDDENGEWLFETTGPAALSLGVWGASEPLARIADTAGRPVPEAVAADPVFGAADDFVIALGVTVDEETITGFETRFAGLFPESMPTDQAVATLVSEADSQESYREEQRLHLTASYSET